MKTTVLIASLALLLTSTAEARKKRKRSGKRKPKISAKWSPIISTGVPHPVDIGVGKIKPKGVSHLLTLGTFDANLGGKGKVKNLKADLNHLEYKFRHEPFWEHPVYWEIGFGYQQILISGEQEIDLSNEGTKVPVPIDAAIDIKSLYTAIHFGMVFYRRGGFYNGFGFGYQIPFYSQADIDASFTGDGVIDDAIRSTSSYQEVENDLEELGVKAGKYGLPYLQIIELGYRF
ncbi:hypothetical protein [Pseudobacteriovorax antillogorgiicola]|uniref:Outer membrane protein beta-barrel domain-containing protein n=1 Tax=Pseudobacteriovorax antillogorgiicola TaxID=1513793 RepID=A0A1Y6BC08_9BACT|nr:hypothetical protein [Pseudobacteriovorax antillogorgiicola]TCS57266.1 hypothetical protein EDD56_1036 [Pseudobacteriovorax antillogorgiicola]SMF03255.1 hypothetical protein SAMN06296036_103327 [Pseudobacteriovorax antillogorgiicola]